MSRPTIRPADIEAAFGRLRIDFDRRLAQHGDGAFASPHELLGVVTEEYFELVEAVRSNRPGDVSSETADVAVACIVRLADDARIQADRVAEAIAGAGLAPPARRLITLETRDGGLVQDIEIPWFTEPPSVIVWGARVFECYAGELYRETRFACVAPVEPAPTRTAETPTP